MSEPSICVSILQSKTCPKKNSKDRVGKRGDKISNDQKNPGSIGYLSAVQRWSKQDETETATRQDNHKTRQDKTAIRQDSRRDETRQGTTRQDETRRDETRQDETRQDKTRRDETQDSATQYKVQRHAQRP